MFCILRTGSLFGHQIFNIIYRVSEKTETKAADAMAGSEAAGNIPKNVPGWNIFIKQCRVSVVMFIVLGCTSVMVMPRRNEKLLEERVNQSKI